jgi:hypothetical protein
MKERWFRKHPRLLLIPVAVFAVLVGILLAELSARVLFPQWAPAREERVKFWKYSELLGWEHRPGQNGHFDHRDFSVEVSINTLGRRDGEASREKGSKRRLLVLGDSFAWGFGVEEEERFSEVLDLSLAGWELLNAAVSGYGTAQELLYLKERGMALKPDALLLLFCENDFLNNVRSEEYWHYRPVFTLEKDSLELRNVPVPRASRRQKVERFLWGKTWLGPRLDMGIWRLKQWLRGKREMTPGTKDIGDFRVTGELLLAIRDRCHVAGIPFLLVSIPMEKEGRNWLRDFASEQNLKLLQLDETFDNSGENLMLPHDNHWNGRGHELAAQTIASWLSETGILDGKKESP